MLEIDQKITKNIENYFKKKNWNMKKKNDKKFTKLHKKIQKIDKKHQ